MCAWDDKRIFRTKRIVIHPERKVISKPGHSGRKLPTYVTIGEDRFLFDADEAFLIKGSFPFRPEGFWTPLYDLLDKRKRYLILYHAPGEKARNKTRDVVVATEINPRLVRVLDKSKLFDEYLRRLQYTGGISPTTLLLVLLGLAAVLGLMYFGGYFK